MPYEELSIDWHLNNTQQYFPETGAVKMHVRSQIFQLGARKDLQTRAKAKKTQRFYSLTKTMFGAREEDLVSSPST